MGHGTFKPCPGCRGTKYRATNSVCKECEATLRAGRAVQKSLEAKEEKQLLFRLTERWPGYYLPTDAREIPEALEAAFEDLVRTAMRPAVTKKDPYDKGILPIPDRAHFSTYEKASVWTCSEKLADAIGKLDRCIIAAIKEALKEGERTGSNLLSQIAQGKVSINELNEAHIRGDRPE